MAKPDWNYRPNESRSVYVFGDFNDELVAKVLPRVAELRAQNSNPITVYIHSRGGIVRYLDVIYAAITGKDVDGASCRMITVASGDASSAAANLFAFGGYAIAHPHSKFHFHGIRMSEVEVTMEDASTLATYLATRNREIALSLAQSMISRLIYRYLLLADAMAEANPDLGNDTLASMQCFVNCVTARVSLPTERILNQTMRRVERVLNLTGQVFPRSKLSADQPGVKQDAAVFRAVLNYELKENKGTDWRLDESGLEKVTADYFLLHDFYLGEQHQLVQTIIETHGYHFLNVDDSRKVREMVAGKETEAASKFIEEKVFPIVKVFWYFTVVLCRHLQQGENRLDAKDAYWIGAADEVLGVDLPGERIIMEAEIDRPAESASAST